MLIRGTQFHEDIEAKIGVASRGILIRQGDDMVWVYPEQVTALIGVLQQLNKGQSVYAVQPRPASPKALPCPPHIDPILHTSLHTGCPSLAELAMKGE